ncbi:hypothetical protein P170DRAFT_479480 [Aspergillus steynii IBT 23096]|uniref:Uncharacterized protein n=1 Tax=Aspergillus steynii IBT 23096 TaxID=1392250 RepID=A0A2I2FWC1_9EURO|nr:uncharacterized protein P170DRAFT_479480 [Aspergillus steynii IBT 23096]PLB44943.1 hypothetical protein P170DRAFT_479480 [Aspergillus steynii IBT 23096]
MLSMSSFCRSKKRHAPEFKVDKAQLETIRYLYSQLSEKPPVDLDQLGDGKIQDKDEAILPRGIPRPNSFYTNNLVTLIPAKDFDPHKKRKLDIA